MTKSLIIFAILFSKIAFGQVPKENIYKNVNGLTFVDSVSWQDIVGSFYLSDGFGGYCFQLDSNMKFNKTDFSCVSNFKLDSGSWTIKNHNTVVVKSIKETLYFDIIKFDNFYFFILPTQRQKFITDLHAARITLKNSKPFKIDNKTYSPDFLIGIILIKKYYAKEIEENTGT